MQVACLETGFGGAHEEHGAELDMGLDTEQEVLKIVATLARVEQKLDSHIEVEQQWRDDWAKKVDATRGWWQLLIASAASSGVFVFLFEWLGRQAGK